MAEQSTNPIAVIGSDYGVVGVSGLATESDDVFG